VTPRIVVLSSPSGAGKTTIAKELLRRRQDLGYSVSATTRPPRPKEQEGKDYFFLSPAQFAQREAAGEFLESADYAGQRYGTLKQEVQRVLASNRHVLLDIEVQGALRVRSAYTPPQLVAIFVLPPSIGALLQRLRQRRSESERALAERLKRGKWELEQLQRDVASTYTGYDRTVVNDNLERTVQEVSSIIDEVPTDRKRPDDALIGVLIRGLDLELDRLHAGTKERT
jgi:guanylate kinase